MDVAADAGGTRVTQGRGTPAPGARRTASALLPAFALLLAGAPLVPSAHGGQVRVNVGTPINMFTPYAVNINQGDHVVWVWTAGNHTVTSWTTEDDSLGASIDGSTFDSDPGGSHFGQNTTTRFSWKSGPAGTVTYLCVPHLPDMTGRVIVSPLATPPTLAVSDFRLTEIRFNAPGGLDLIEITNHGQAAGDLGRYRLAVTGTGTGVEFAFNSFSVPAGGRVVVHAATAGTNDATNIYLPGLPSLNDAAGSVALYVPSTLSFQNALTNASLMIDFVQWGAAAQANEATAAAAGLWTAGTSIDGVAAGHSIEYCPNATLDHGVQRWAEIVPNIGSVNDCSTPTLRETWGRLKIIYRQ